MDKTKIETIADNHYITALFDNYTGELIMRGTACDCAMFCRNEAFSKNYGIMRTWTEDERDYYDCGARVYFIDRTICDEPETSAK